MGYSFGNKKMYILLLVIIPYPMTYGEVQLLKHMHQIHDLEL